MSVLVPMDGSAAARRALTLALEEYPASEIIVLHVIDPPSDAPDEDTLESIDWEALIDEGEAQAAEVFDEADTLADQHDDRITTDSIVGKPATAIVKYATDHDVEHIVIGSHGRQGVSRVLLGSVAERVARRAPVPVTIVPAAE